MTSPLGDWQPLPLAEAIATVRGWDHRWWISGGHALELHTGRSWRDHSDTDIGVLRQDAVHLHDVLDGWDVHIASGGRLHPWDGREPIERDGENNLWARRDPAGPWLLDLTLGDGDSEHWIFRRDRSVRVPWAEAVLRTSDGVPYLAPQLVLLFKSRDRRAKDEIGATQAIPALEPARAEWLARHLEREHPWLERLR